MSEILSAADARFDIETQVLIIGAGSAGVVAALAAREGGADVLLLERDPAPSGSTALSSGLIPAAGTRFQRSKGIEDDSTLFAQDILNKSKDEADPAMVRRVAEEAGPALEWLADAHGLVFDVLDGFLYPGHSRLRMHAVPERTGAALMNRLGRALSASGADLVVDAPVTALYVEDDGHLAGARVTRPDGAEERVKAAAIILACNGYGGEPSLVRRFIPEMAEALYFGHPGNRGDAVLWGERLGARLRHMSGYQGHGSVAHPHGVLITWALMMEGGFQINAQGERFADEREGYSEQAVAVLAQPGGVAWCVFDERLHRLGMTFEDYKNAVALGALKSGETIEALAVAIGAPAEALVRTAHERGSLTEPPFHAVRVTGALFHTQGGLDVDEDSRVRRENGSAFSNLFAAGGAAVGVSGGGAAGYLSGNGLLTAVTLGRRAGTAASRLRRR